MSTRSLSRTLTSGANAAQSKLYVTTGLQQYFDATTTSLTSSTWADRQGLSNLTLAATPTVSTTGAASNKFVTFNGSTQYATGFTGAVSLSTFSVYMWIKTTQTVVNATYYLRPTILGMGLAGAGTNDWLITISGGSLGFYHGMGTGDQERSSGIVVNDGKWHELVLTCSIANGMKLFVDTVQAGTAAPVARASDATTQPQLGRTGGQNSNYSNFSCGVLMVYGSRELTATDMATNRAYFAPRYLLV